MDGGGQFFALKLYVVMLQSTIDDTRFQRFSNISAHILGGRGAEINSLIATINPLTRIAN